MLNQPILLVEDSPEDFEMVKWSFRMAGLPNSLHWCSDGDEALEYLQQFRDRQNEKAADRPGVILLDLNMPGTDGQEVLADLKSDEVLKHIPVVILSTSNSDRDVDSCYALGAYRYMTKPLNIEDFLGVLNELNQPQEKVKA